MSLALKEAVSFYRVVHRQDLELGKTARLCGAVYSPRGAALLCPVT